MDSQVLEPKQVVIMGNVFQPAELRSLVECLENDGHRCAIFDSFVTILQAHSQSINRLLFVGVIGSQLPSLVEMIRTELSRISCVPILLFLKEYFAGTPELLVPEIDDFLLEPLNLYDVRVRVGRLLQRYSETGEEIEPAKQSLVSHFGMQQFVGRAPSFLEVTKKIPRLAGCDAPVLLIGETGTGKEMCARAIHYLSSRSNRPFVPVNCGSIPVDLFENELFGHESGAFTDARQPHRGLIAEAEGGTLFLDELETLPLLAQAKLLRFLQDRHYKPLGTSRPRQADVRVLAATNEDLQEKVRQRAFRQDLYFRLNVVSLRLPPLRERQEDILPLACHFLQNAANEYHQPVNAFSSDAVRKLSAYSWPGNVRELENLVRQAVVLSEGPGIRARDLQLFSESPCAAAPFPEPLRIAKARLIEGFERIYLKEVLSACGGNISEAARRAQKNRRAFFALLKKYNLTTTTHKLYDAKPGGQGEILSLPASA